MTKLNELKVAFGAATPGEWWEDDDGFVAAGHGDSYRTVADARCDVAPFSDANTEFITLAHNLMPQLLEAVVELGRFVEYLGVAGCDGAYDREIERAVNLLENLK